MILQTNSCVLCRVNNISKDRSNKINERSVRGKANKSKMGEKLTMAQTMWRFPI